MRAKSTRIRRRGSLLVELAMAAVLLMIAMALTVKVLGLVAHERRASERRQRALVEVANLMEQITAYPFEEVTPELGRRLSLRATARQSLPDAELAVEVADKEPGAGRSARRIAIRLSWRAPGGEPVAPVRLSSWIERRRSAP
jgi:hypothetical protein